MRMTSSRNAVRWSLTVLFTATLAACGGGGSSTQATLLAITAANSDAVSRAAAVGALSLGATTALPLAPSPTSAWDGPRGRLALGSGARGGSWASRVVAGLLPGPGALRPTARTDVKRPLAVIGPETENCALSGTLSITLDDRDGNNAGSVGDVVTFVFTNCRDTADETINGTVEATVLAINPGGTAVTADVRLRSLSAATARWSLTADGTLRLAYSTPSLGSPQETYDLTAIGAVAASVVTQLPFSDSGTLADGWHEVSTYDGSVQPVAGNVESGRDTLTVNGTLDSTAAGGRVTVSTPTPFTTYGEDPYPRAGVLHVQGDGSALRLTALSSASVQIDLDANGDNLFEATRTEAWDWLI